jgi:hypothetical protein
MEPSNLHAEPGPIPIQGTNEGQAAHNFSLEGQATPMLQPGESATLKVPSLNPGEFEFICEVTGHADGGMRGTLTVGQGADERQTSPQIVNSVTVEVSVDGAKKIALARNVGSLSLLLRSAADVVATGEGLTPISSFGGTIAAGASRAFEAITAEPEGPKFKTVIVTRGTVPQTYQVVSPENE